MRRRPLGRSGIEVSALGLGCMGMSEFYGAADETESRATLERALELGIDFFDTADAYGCGANEELLGRVFRGRWDRLVLATKFGIVRTEDPSFRALSGKPEYARKACEASLRRLGTERIDLYYLHRVDNETPIEETVGAMSELVKEGKVAQLGLSEAAPATLRRAHAVHPIAAVQTEYSLFSRDPEREMLATCLELGVTFVAYSPLGRGLLTGTIRTQNDLAPEDWRRGVPRFQGENLRRNAERVARIEALALEKGCTPTQLALAFVLAQGEHIVPIPGTKRRRYLEDNVRALAVELSAADLEALDQAAPLGATAGTRYAEALMGWLDR
jgi:aryl-alcohol dehydrogenase-like predicted oxidoreductase